MKRVWPRDDGKIWYDDAEVGDVFLITEGAMAWWTVAERWIDEDTGHARGSSRPLKPDEVQALILHALTRLSSTIG